MPTRHKKVIFVGGTAFSGSTFFDLILANDPSGFSCGEIRALFHPSRSHHVKPTCACGIPDCKLWSHVLSAGPTDLYNTIFALVPEVKFIVDSSKRPYWIKWQAENLHANGIECKHILIWKTPLEFAYSCKKRAKTIWHKDWVNYHRLYLTAIQDWKSVKYYDFANDPDTLKKVCDYLQIPYFPHKRRYWNKRHHTVFGNDSARIHLEPRNDESNVEIQNVARRISKNSDVPNDLHRTIYYKKVNDKALEGSVLQQLANNKILQQILNLLNDRDISNDLKGTYIPAHLRLSKLQLHLRTAKRLIIRQVMKLKYR